MVGDALGVPALEEREKDPTETTAFRGDDPECLVAAGLACRMCLSGDVDCSLSLEPWDDRALCRCRRCGHGRTVALTGDQALRLSLRRGGERPCASPAPPVETWATFPMYVSG
jgi:hypothetical protein